MDALKYYAFVGRIRLSRALFPLNLLIVLISAILVMGSDAYATENGGSAYIGGNEDFMVGILPPPGWYPMLYTSYYTADKLMDNEGDEIPIDFNVEVYGGALRLVRSTALELFGANYAFHVIVPFSKQSMEITDFNLDESTSGIGDIEISPFILGWHFSKNLHIVGAFDVWVPIGSYDEDDRFSIGRNYWTFAPILTFTFISNWGFELSAKMQYLINTENPDTEYTSGNEFITDYLVGQHIGKNLTVGFSGAIYKQITDDEQNGSTIEDNKGQYISIGPAVQYQYKNMYFVAKAQFDTEVENRPEGQKYWLKFIYEF